MDRPKDNEGPRPLQPETGASHLQPIHGHPVLLHMLGGEFQNSGIVTIVKGFFFSLFSRLIGTVLFQCITNSSLRWNKNGTKFLHCKPVFVSTT